MIREGSGTLPVRGLRCRTSGLPLHDLRPLPKREWDKWTGDMSGNLFVGDHILMDVCPDSARRQLERLAGDGVLLSASEYAYSAGITALAEAAGPAAGMSRLVGVRSGDLVETEGCARLWLRWEAIGSAGTLFAALDADLTLSPAGENITVLTLAGVYRLPQHV